MSDTIDTNAGFSMSPHHLAAIEVGKLLSAERARQKITLKTIADYLKIRKYYLEEIETGRIQELIDSGQISPVYAYGFVRSYAAYLGLDVGYVMSLYPRTQSDEMPLTTPYTQQQQVLSTYALPSKTLQQRSLIVAIVLIVGGAGAIKYFSGDEGDHSVPTAVNAVMLPQALESSAPTTSTVQAVLGDNAGKGDVAALPLTPTKVEDKTQESKDSKPATEGNSATAASTCWVKVTGQGGHVLLNKTMQPAEVISLSADATAITIGDASAITIKYSGKTFNKLGPKGKVIRDLPLKVDSLTKLTKKDDEDEE